MEQGEGRESDNPQAARGDALAIVGIAAAAGIMHVLTNGRYGFHRDELQFLSDARHLDWGFVAYPPLTAFLEHIGLAMFGVSMAGLRLFSVLAQAAAIVLTGLMARELGGGRLAQVAAALSVALSPLPLFEGTEFQYSSFDYLWWVAIAYFVIRLLKSEDPRWWLAIGAGIGVGLMTKYSILFWIAGILGGMALTRARRFFASGWFWGGVAVALVVFGPNFLWQVHHGFISYQFLQHIHQRDVRIGRSKDFLQDQFLICANVFAAPLWIGGLAVFFRDRRYRMPAWMYVIPLALFVAAKGRGYYLAGAYPMLIAMGAAAGEGWAATLPDRWRRPVEIAFFAGVAGWGALAIALLVPIASSGPLRRFALKNNGDLREEIGWVELVKTVAAIRDSLPAEQRASFGVLVGNYGEQGAIEILGQSYGLPLPISTTNSAWLRGYPEPPPTTLIVIGISREAADDAFLSCRLAGHNGNSEGVDNEESHSHPEIFVCGGPRQPWPEFWKDHQNFG
jgi:4-amino-4-deoxy-L-arabinose transferase-like glycosyltransferase